MQEQIDLRNAQLFGQNYDVLATSLENMRFVNPNGVIGTFLKTRGYPRAENETPLYLPVTRKMPGGIYVATVQGRLVTLVAALDGGQPGGCVKIHRVGRVQGENVIPLKNAGDATELLGLVKGSIARLVFVDNSPRLYVMRDESSDTLELPQVVTRVISEHVARSAFDKIVGE